MRNEIGFSLLVTALLITGCTNSPDAANSMSESSATAASETVASENVASRCPKGQITDRDYAVRDTAILKTEPTEQASPSTYAFPEGSDPQPAAIDGSVSVREMCRAGKWSQVRVLYPEYVRQAQGWVQSSNLKAVKTDARGHRIYNVSDFEWLPGTGSHKSEIVAVANKVMKEDRRCEAIDDKSITADPNGIFQMACVGPDGTFSIQFTARDATNGRNFNPFRGATEL